MSADKKPDTPPAPSREQLLAGRNELIRERDERLNALANSDPRYSYLEGRIQALSFALGESDGAA